MKKIIKPCQKEECTYFSDFTGRPLGQTCPPVELQISFNYGSKNDGANIVLDMDDNDAELLIDFLKNKALKNCDKFKNLI